MELNSTDRFLYIEITVLLGQQNVWLLSNQQKCCVGPKKCSLIQQNTFLDG